MNYKKFVLSKLTQIDTKTLGMNLNFILFLISNLRDEKKMLSTKVIFNQGRG